MQIDRLDHLVLTVSDMGKSLSFYANALGMQIESFGGNRKALRFGNQKINLHHNDAPIKPHATHPVPGSADLCFISSTPLEMWLSHLERLAITVEDGPVQRTGATGPIISIYLRDPDSNLIEISNYL